MHTCTCNNNYTVESRIVDIILLLLKFMLQAVGMAVQLVVMMIAPLKIQMEVETTKVVCTSVNYYISTRSTGLVYA